MNSGLKKTAMLLCPRLKGGKPLIISCPMSAAQRTLLAELEERKHALLAEIEEWNTRLRNGNVDFEKPRASNITMDEGCILALDTDYYKLALDARLLSAAARDFPGSKINALVKNVADIWQQTTPKRSTQLIFCDIGSRPTAWGYSLYQEIVDKLVAHGIPHLEIATTNEADTVAKKQELFEYVRQGTIRVLLGSTQSMGTGTRVENLLVALHHLDVPWRSGAYPAFMQREGRIIHPKNIHEEVAIYRYITEGTSEAYAWDNFDTKNRFIDRIMTGEQDAVS
jgi:hypothetical protein